MEERLHHPTFISKKNSISKKHSISKKKLPPAKKNSKAEERYPLKLSTSRYLFFFTEEMICFSGRGLVSKNINTSYI